MRVSIKTISVFKNPKNAVSFSEKSVHSMFQSNMFSICKVQSNIHEWLIEEFAIDWFSKLSKSKLSKNQYFVKMSNRVGKLQSLLQFYFFSPDVTNFKFKFKYSIQTLNFQGQICCSSLGLEACALMTSKVLISIPKTKISLVS